MAYGIMRVEKRKRPAVYGLQMEANRTEEGHEAGRDFSRSDIDWERTHNNIFIKRTENWNKEITRQIHAAGIRERENSVVMLDAIFTASPEFFQSASPSQIGSFFADCLRFYIDEFCNGDSEKVINAVIHLDEKTPHLQVASVPLLEDEKGVHLSAKTIMGNKTDYRIRQDRFFDEVSSKYGLERGEKIENRLILSRAEDAKIHTQKREWQIMEQEKKIKEIEDRLSEETNKLQEILNRQNEAEQRASAAEDRLKKVLDIATDISSEYEQETELYFDWDR